MSDDSCQSDSDEEEIYNVECIVAESWDHDRRKPLYLVKWEDYDLYEATWETQSSFEEGAEEVLRDWSEVKQQRLEGKIPAFDLQDFETKRARWLSDATDHDNVELEKDAVHETLHTQKQSDSDDSSESAAADEPRTLPATYVEPFPRAALEAPAVDIPQDPSSEVTNSRTTSLPTQAITTEAAHKSIGSTKSIPSSKPVQKNIAIDEDLYKMPESMSRYKTLNLSVKRKYKDSTPTQNDTTNPGGRSTTHENVSLQHPRTLPKFSKITQDKPEQRMIGVMALTEAEHQHSEGVAHLTDHVSKNPQALYDVLVKIRGRQWKLFISEAAFDAVAQEANSFGNHVLKLDYQTLRQKNLISLHESHPNPLQIAAQERLQHLGEYNRYVVIRGEYEKWDYIPQGLEVFTVEHFRP